MRGGNSEGFSLIEVIVALFIGGIIAAGAASLVSLSVKSNRNVAMIADNSELASVAQQLLTDPNTCTLNLAGADLDTVAFTEKTVNLTYPKTDPANPLKLIRGDPVVQNHRFGKLEVGDLTLLPHAQVSADVWLVALRMRTHKTGDHFGAQDSLNDVIAHVRVNSSNQVTNCEPTREIASVQLDDTVVNEKICSLGTGGAKLYDVTGKDCSLPNPLAPPPKPPSSSGGPVALSEEICQLVSGGTRSFDPTTQKCADRTVFRVKAVNLQCECPAPSKLWWTEAGLNDYPIPPQFCVQFSEGDPTCAHYAAGADGGGPNKGSCIFAPEIDLSVIPPEKIVCNCVCLGGMVKPVESSTP